MRSGAKSGTSTLGTRLGAGLLNSFGLAFAAMGVFAWSETRHTQGGWLPVIGGLTFVAFGLGLVWLVVAGLRGTDEGADRREALALLELIRETFGWKPGS